MKLNLLTTVVLICLVAGMAPPTAAQRSFDPEAEIAAQREAMEPLALMDGVWRGSAWTLLPTGEKHTITQTERIGPFLDGSVKVIEGRGYNAEGEVSFNAFGIISYDRAESTYSMRSYAMGRSGDFPVKVTPEGFAWQIPAGPATIRYNAVITDSTWHEVGDRVMPDSDPVRFFEMNLVRLGDTDWPAGDPVSPE